MTSRRIPLNLRNTICNQGKQMRNMAKLGSVHFWLFQRKSLNYIWSLWNLMRSAMIWRISVSKKELAQISKSQIMEIYLMKLYLRFNLKMHVISRRNTSCWLIIALFNLLMNRTRWRGQPYKLSMLDWKRRTWRTTSRNFGVSFLCRRASVFSFTTMMNRW